jgi:hypothetical protein
MDPGQYHIGELKRGSLRKIRPQEIAAIRRYLHIPDGIPFPKCGAKLRQPPDGHEAEDHICEECRCKRVAGDGTRGWYYWPKDNDQGLIEVGHYGVGPCRDHEKRGKGRKGIMQDRAIESEIISTQQRGVAPRDGDRFRIELAKKQEDITLRRDVKEARKTVRNILDKYKSQIADGANLTEKGGPSGSIPITDKSRIELSVLIAKALSDISRTEFMSAQDEYVHRDEMLAFVNRILRVSEQFIKQKDDWDDFISQFKQALYDVKSGKDKMSGHQDEV